MDFEVKKEQSFDELNEVYFKRGREVIEYIKLFGTQHIADIPDFKSLAEDSRRNDRKAIKMFHKIDDSGLMRFPPIKIVAKAFIFVVKSIKKLV